MFLAAVMVVVAVVVVDVFLEPPEPSSFFSKIFLGTETKALPCKNLFQGNKTPLKKMYGPDWVVGCKPCSHSTEPTSAQLPPLL